MSNKATGIGRRMAIGAAWTIAMRFAVSCIGLVSTVILAHLLIPEDFGLVALATMIYGFLERMGQFNFDMALIREPNTDRNHYDTTWTLTLIRNSVVAGALVALAIPAAGFFGDPRLEPIIYWLAAISVLEGLKNVGVVDFRKALLFHKDFTYNLISKLGGFFVTVPLALFWRNYWALIAGMLSAKVTGLTASYLMHSYRPRLSLSVWREQIDFSKWLLVNNILNFVNNRSVTLLIAKFGGVHSLGLYNVAFEISNLPTSELVAPIRRALFPGYSKLIGNHDSLTRSYLDGLSLILIIAVPLGIGIHLLAEPLIVVALGQNWLEAVPLVEILAIYGVVTISLGNSGPLILALGKPKILVRIKLITLLVLVPAVTWGIWSAGAWGAAVALVVAASLRVSLLFLAIKRLLDLPTRRIVSAVWRTYAASTAMVIAVLVLQAIWPAQDTTGGMALQLVCISFAGAVTYGLAMLVLWNLSGRPEGGEQHIVTALSNALAKNWSANSNRSASQ